MHPSPPFFHVVSLSFFSFPFEYTEYEYVESTSDRDTVGPERGISGVRSGGGAAHEWPWS